MRKVVMYHLLSADGVSESPEDYFLDFDEEMYDNLARTIKTQDTVLLGRRMYDEWSRYWPDSDHEPFASFINAVRKIVVTTRPLERKWSGATASDRPLASLVADLKGEPGRDIGVHGSTGLSRSLLEAGLVDELRLVIAPAIAGRGRRLFPEGSARHRLELLRATGTPSGAVLVDYAVASG